MTKCDNFKNEVDFIRRRGNECSGKGNTIQRCESGKSQDSCRTTANSPRQALKTYDKVWWGYANCGGGLVSPVGCRVQKTMRQLRQVFWECELAEDGLEKEAAKGLPK